MAKVLDNGLWADGCVYCRTGVVCSLPAIRGGVPPECARCGWSPEVWEQRIGQAREKLHWDGFERPAVPIGERYNAERRRPRDYKELAYYHAHRDEINARRRAKRREKREAVGADAPGGPQSDRG